MQKTVALVLSRLSEYATRLFEGAVRYAGEHDDITILDLGFSRPGRSPLPKGKLPFQGALVWLSPRDRWVKRLLSDGIVTINTNGDLPANVVPIVAFDGNRLPQMAYDHLAMLKRSRFAFIGYDTSDSPEERILADRFLALAKKDGQSTQLFTTGKQTSETFQDDAATLDQDSLRKLKQFLRQLPKPASVWCQNDFMGLTVCNAAQALGISIPEDLAVLGMGDYRVAQFCRPRLSSIPQPGQLIGYETMKIIDGILSSRIAAANRFAFPSPMVEWRESTGGGSMQNNPILRARKFIADHAGHGVTVNEVMKTVRLSQRVFTKKFFAAVGHTPGKEIRNVRIAQARHYLMTTNLSMGRIAELCGYNQQSDFCNFFKRETGMTPSKCRRSRNVAS